MLMLSDASNKLTNSESNKAPHNSNLGTRIVIFFSGATRVLAGSNIGEEWSWVDMI